jgi:probable rRNA maturation factor
MPVRFFYENTRFKIKNPRKTVQWIKQSAKREKRLPGKINFIFCPDSYLLNLNETYLGHETLTDVITFNYSKGKLISGEIYISIERVKENSRKFSCEFEEELKRVMIHGILHLSGYNDKFPSDVIQMRKKEDAYLSLHKKMFHVKR